MEKTSSAQRYCKANNARLSDSTLLFLILRVISTHNSGDHEKLEEFPELCKHSPPNLLVSKQPVRVEAAGMLFFGSIKISNRYSGAKAEVSSGAHGPAVAFNGLGSALLNVALIPRSGVVTIYCSLNVLLIPDPAVHA